jgi:hypothetical protein
MSRGAWVCLLALFVAACAHSPVDGRLHVRDTFVHVDQDGLLYVDQEPIRLKNPNAAIVWFLDPVSGDTFAPERGIDAGGDFDCRRIGNGKQYECKLKAGVKPGQTYKYRVTVLDRDGHPRPTLDPTIVSNF